MCSPACELDQRGRIAGGLEEQPFAYGGQPWCMTIENLGCGPVIEPR